MQKMTISLTHPRAGTITAEYEIEDADFLDLALATRERLGSNHPDGKPKTDQEIILEDFDLIFESRAKTVEELRLRKAIDAARATVQKPQNKRGRS